jgi:hypothetical protein
MTILNLYQLVFILTVVGVFAAGYWAKRQMPSHAIVEQLRYEPYEETRSPVKASLDFVHEHVRALDVLFDDHLLSVDEYVELRKRISTGQTV